MQKLHGRGLLGTVTAVTCLGFMLVGYDNGVMGGLVNQKAFNTTFNTPDATMIGLIVAIYEGRCTQEFRSDMSAV